MDIIKYDKSLLPYRAGRFYFLQRQQHNFIDLFFVILCILFGNIVCLLIHNILGAVPIVTYLTVTSVCLPRWRTKKRDSNTTNVSAAIGQISAQLLRIIKMSSKMSLWIQGSLGISDVDVHFALIVSIRDRVLLAVATAQFAGKYIYTYSYTNACKVCT